MKIQTLRSLLSNFNYNLFTSSRLSILIALLDIPTMLLFKGGELKATKVGATTKSNIISWIKENI